MHILITAKQNTALTFILFIIFSTELKESNRNGVLC